MHHHRVVRLFSASIFRGAIAVVISISMTCVSSADPVHVNLIRSGDGWQLVRNGVPFFIQGAGGDASKQALKEAGGNCVRTWGVDADTEAVLDEAHRCGLTVCVGIWLGHERHGFDYSNDDMVGLQLEKTRSAVARLKDHPALLLWGIGNEMEGLGKGDNPAIWKAVDETARLVNELDPNHPTMTTIAEIGGDRVKSIHRYCPNVDIVGINSYGGAVSIPERYRKAGGRKPYVITEFGPPGSWEVGRNSWGAPIELTSTDKAERYRQAWLKGIAAEQDKLSLGGFAFIWGNKQEATATWFGMFLPDGNKLGAVDVMTKLWTGTRPANCCPRIEAIRLIGPDLVQRGAEVLATLDTSDPEQDPLEARWVLQGESAEYATGGDRQAVPPTYPKAIAGGSTSEVKVQLPDRVGRYRLYAYVHDGNGGAATANVPIMCQEGGRAQMETAVKLPLVVYGDDTTKGPYVASGWMGDANAITMDGKCNDRPHTGKTCLKVAYSKTDGWGGVVWQYPANDWGERPGGYDLSGAKRLSFWARGSDGGEKVKFGFGILGRDKKYFDTAKAEKEIVLADKWKAYSFELSGRDLTRIKTGFVWVVTGQGHAVSFFLDDVRFE